VLAVQGGTDSRDGDYGRFLTIDGGSAKVDVYDQLAVPSTTLHCYYTGKTNSNL
jgi:hypothetical protein